MEFKIIKFNTGYQLQYVETGVYLDIERDTIDECVDDNMEVFLPCLAKSIRDSIEHIGYENLRIEGEIEFLEDDIIILNAIIFEGDFDITEDVYDYIEMIES